MAHGLLNTALENAILSLGSMMISSLLIVPYDWLAVFMKKKIRR
jgi:hypothetical protein